MKFILTRHNIHVEGLLNDHIMGMIIPPLHKSSPSPRHEGHPVYQEYLIYFYSAKDNNNFCICETVLSQAIAFVCNMICN